MGEPLLVSIRAADPPSAREFAEALREELERRGAGPMDVRIEVGQAAAGAEAVVVEAEGGVARAAGEVLARLRGRPVKGEPPPSGRDGAGGQRSSAYSAEEEEEVRRRLEDLGYF